MLERDFGGSLEGVPADVRGEAIMTIIQGAAFGCRALLTYYTDREDKFVTEEVIDYQHYVNNLVPDWWPVTKQ